MQANVPNCHKSLIKRLHDSLVQLCSRVWLFIPEVCLQGKSFTTLSALFLQGASEVYLLSFLTHCICYGSISMESTIDVSLGSITVQNSCRSTILHEFPFGCGGARSTMDRGRAQTVLAWASETGERRLEGYLQELCSNKNSNTGGQPCPEVLHQTEQPEQAEKTVQSV